MTVTEAGDLAGAPVLMTLDAVGGVWRYAMDLASALVPHGFSFVFAGFGPPPQPHQRQEAERLGTLIWHHAPLDWMVETGEALEGIGALIRETARAEGAGLIHLNLPSQAADLNAPVPVVTVSHSCVPSWFRQTRGEAPPDHWRWHVDLNRRGLEQADVAIAPSSSHAQTLHQVYGQGPKIQVVHNSSRASLCRNAGEPFVFAAARWWDDAKNAAVLDAAAAQIRWPVQLAGPLNGPSGARRQISSAAPLGEIPHAGVTGQMRRAAIFVSPSLYEPFGLAALEAARAGAALVLADIPTYRELWDGAALFFDPGNPDALARSVNALSDDAFARRKLSSRSRQRSLRFSPAAQAQAMSTVYRGLITGGQTLEAAE